jgi:hypothetical protein
MNYTFIILNTSNYGAHYKLAINKYSALYKIMARDLSSPHKKHLSLAV